MWHVLSMYGSARAFYPFARLVSPRKHCFTVKRQQSVMNRASSENHLEVAIRAAKAAGAVISAALSLPKQVQNKGAVDLVTETDKECETLILETVKSSFPDHLFIGEETTAEEGNSIELTDTPTWLCDPLDGTTNFVHQYPSCCVSLALWIKREPVVGVVFNPVLKELFTAERGKGAFLNGVPIRTSETNELEKAVFATELGVTRDVDVITAIFSRISRLSAATRSIRCAGSVAIDLCNVACGRLDFCYEIGFGGCWDIGAGTLIIMEAGGKVLDPCGGPFNVLSRRILGTNAHLDKKVSEILSTFDFYANEPRP